MIRNLKVLGVAFAAVLALSAMAASAASADTFQSEGGQETTLTGAQESADKFIFKTTAGSVTCPTFTFHAQSKSNVSTVETTELTFPATGCLCIGIACTVTTNGCNFRLHLNVTDGTADLACPPGKELTLDSAKCIIHVPDQVGLAGLTFSNAGTIGTATGEITIKSAITTISYSHTKVAEGIGSCNPGGTGTSGSFTGSAIVTGEKVAPGTGHVGIFVK